MAHFLAFGKTQTLTGSAPLVVRDPVVRNCPNYLKSGPDYATITVQGKLERWITEDPLQSFESNHVLFQLSDGSGEQIELILGPETLRQLDQNDALVVRLTGRKFKCSLIVDTLNQMQVVQTQSAVLKPMAVSNRRLALVFISFLGSTGTDDIIKLRQKLMVGASGLEDGVNEVFARSSNQLWRFTGVVNKTAPSDAFGWYMLPINATKDFYVILDALIPLLPFNIDSYDHIALIIKENPGCPWAGIAQLGGKWSMTRNESPHDTVRVLMHELVGIFF